MQIRKFVCDGCQEAVEVPVGPLEVTDVDGPVGWHVLQGFVTMETDVQKKEDALREEKQAFFDAVTESLPAEMREGLHSMIDVTLPNDAALIEPTTMVSYTLEVCPKCLGALPTLVRMTSDEKRRQA